MVFLPYILPNQKTSTCNLMITQPQSCGFWCFFHKETYSQFMLGLRKRDWSSSSSSLSSVSNLQKNVTMPLVQKNQPSKKMFDCLFLDKREIRLHCACHHNTKGHTNFENHNFCIFSSNEAYDIPLKRPWKCASNGILYASFDEEMQKLS